MCVASCDEFCIFEKLYVETFFAFCLDSCIVKKGRNLCITWAPGSICKVFKVVRVGFEKFGVGSVSCAV
jgi:hypothetical protein